MDGKVVIFAVITRDRIYITAEHTDRTVDLAISERPESFHEADKYLADHGFIRAIEWDLGNQGIVIARVVQGKTAL